MLVVSKERGFKKLKEGFSLEQYKAIYPSAREAKAPSLATLRRWDNEFGGCKTPDGCKVEPDGVCSHGWRSWMLLLGYL